MAKKKSTKQPPHIHEQHPNLLWLLLIFLLVLVGVFLLKTYYLDKHYTQPHTMTDTWSYRD